MLILDGLVMSDWESTESLAGCLIFMKCEKWLSQSEIVSSEQLDTYVSSGRSVYYVRNWSVHKMDT